MPDTEEEGGRLNAFAKEPKIEVIQNQANDTNGSRLIIFGGAVLLVVLIALTISIS